MTWGKIDDQLAFHPKALEAGNEALGMWVRSMSYSCQMLTGGFISNEIVLAMGGPKIAGKLVQARLWEIVEGGYQFHDWEQYQPCAETEKAKREETRKARSEAGKLGANARWNSKDKPEPMANGMANAMANAMANGWQNDAPEPEPEPIKNIIQEPDERKTSLKANWEPSEAGIEFAKSRAPSLVIADEVQRFKDYNAANGRRMVDWEATWRTWVMNVIRFRPEVTNQPPPPKKQFGIEPEDV